MIEDIDLKENGHAVSTLGSSLTLGLVGINGVPDLIKVILERQAWRKRFVAATRQVVEFHSFTAFLDAHQPEGLHAKYEDLWRLCHERPDVQAMLDEAVKESHGGDRKTEIIKMDNIHLDNGDGRVNYQGGTSRAAGLRKLRKHAASNPEVAEVYTKVLAGEVSINKALLDTGLRKTPVKTIPISSAEVMADKLLDNLPPSEISKLRDLINIDGVKDLHVSDNPSEIAKMLAKRFKGKRRTQLIEILSKEP